MVYNISRQSEVKNETFNHNTILEEISERAWDGSTYDRRIIIKSYILEDEGKEETTGHGRVLETARETYTIPQGTDKINRRSQAVRCDDAKCLYKGCNRVFRTRTALTIHHKRLHRHLMNAPLLPKRSDEFKQEGSIENNYKRCKGKEL